MSAHKVQTRYNYQIAKEDEDYFDRLQRYSTLFRILLAQPYNTEITLNTWNRVDLKLANELGLTLTPAQKKTCWLEIGCQLIVEEGGQFKSSTDNRITCRPLQRDAWENNTESDIAGFYHDTDGDFEYMISAGEEAILLLDNGSNKKKYKRYYIQIYPTCKPQQMIQAFHLVIGPIHINDKFDSWSQMEVWGRKEDKQVASLDIYHAYCIQKETFLLIKEIWAIGTPGKMWDSALVLSQLLRDQITVDPTRFKGHRILDLSAGTGCVGLLISLLYKNIFYTSEENRPKITMTDLPDHLDLMYKNRAANHLDMYADIRPLTWGNYDDVQNLLKDGPIHTIIASDVLYEPSSFSKLVQTLDWLSTETVNIDIYLGYKRRGLSPEDETKFFNICSEKFIVKVLPTHVETKLLSNEGWIAGSNHGGFSNIFKETGVHIYQLIRK